MLTGNPIGLLSLYTKIYNYAICHSRNLNPRKLEIVLVEPTKEVSTRTDSRWNLYWIELSRNSNYSFLNIMHCHIQFELGFEIVLVKLKLPK